VPDELKKLLERRDKKLLFVGIGNLLKMDDGVGVYISRKIKNIGNISAINAETSIENYIGKINCLNPDLLILIDCLEMNSTPGTCKLLDICEIEDLTFNTHNISVRRLSEFFDMPVFILGIQPEKIDFGENISYLVMEESEKIINIINSY
jgi:hydrogenase 3 maturation protease